MAGTSTQQTTSTTNDTYQVVGTLTASGSLAITNAGLADTSTSAPQTTLSAAVSSATATSISVTSATGFPSTGNYDIQVSTEVMTVTGGQGTTTWTVTRGANGSTALASIANGYTVTGGKSCAGGNLFMKGDFAVINLSSTDTLTLTAKVQYS